MAVYAFDFHPHMNGPLYGPDGQIVRGGNQITCDPPFTFGPHDVVTVIVEARDFGGDLSGDPIPVTSVIFHDASGIAAVAYFPTWGSAGTTLMSLTGNSPYQAEIRLSDLFAPVFFGANGSIIQFPTERQRFSPVGMDSLVVTDIVVEGLLQEWMTGGDVKYYLTIITPDGGVSKFWTGFKGCGELD